MFILFKTAFGFMSDCSGLVEIFGLVVGGTNFGEEDGEDEKDGEEELTAGKTTGDEGADKSRAEKNIKYKAKITTPRPMAATDLFLFLFFNIFFDFLYAPINKTR